MVPESVERLVTEFGRLPGIGPKTAQRLAFHCLRTPAEVTERLGQTLQRLHQVVGACTRCFFIAEGELCAVCSDATRDQSVICAVEEALDVIAVERSGEFRGLYHVLGGALSPMDGVGPDELRIAELERRVADGGVREVVVATDPDVEGEATAFYLGERLAPLGITVSRLAHGLPAGADLEYADELTVARAFAGRRSL
ncbi:MAG: recombination mediator RecR [Candidatus Dormibacteria bacterium]